MQEIDPLGHRASISSDGGSRLTPRPTATLGCELNVEII
jgi:hypothetical protein